MNPLQNDEDHGVIQLPAEGLGIPRIDLPDVFTVVNDIRGLAEPTELQFRCWICNQLQSKNNRSRHRNNCRPSILLSHLRNTLALFEV
jgi:hypothetical protein